MPPPPSLPPPVQGRGGGQRVWEMGGRQGGSEGAGRRWRRGESSDDACALAARGSELAAARGTLISPCLHGHMDVGLVGRERPPGPLIAVININRNI